MRRKNMEIVLGLGILIFLITLYFVPTFVAKDRKHPNAAPIFILNLFFGWTLLGWVICLAWAFSSIKQATDASKN
jgi:hypothetical protein